MNKLLVIGTLAAIAMNAQAALLTLAPGATALDGVNVAKTATVTVAGSTETLTAVGAGIRSKKVLFINVKAYVGELFTDAPQKFVKGQASQLLSSVDGAHTSAILMTFVHDVSSDQLTGAFNDGFNANHIDTSSTEVTDFMNKITAMGDVSSGQAMSFVATATNNNTQDLVVIQDQKGNQVSVTGPRGFGHNIMSLWLGVAADGGVADFENQVAAGL